MTKLLSKEVFDFFLLEKADIKTAIDYHIEGRLHDSFFDTDELRPEEDFEIWQRIRPLCYEMIKGKKMPLSFSIVLRAPQKLQKEVLNSHTADVKNNVSSLMLCIRMEQRQINCITGTALSTFSLNKEAENSWDEWCQNFLLSIDPQLLST